MVDLEQLRATIDAQSPTGDAAAIVTRDWLEEVEQDLRELADRRAQDGDQN
jgi:hypothetical protein